MKRIVVLLAAVAATAVARADLVLQQQITAANYNGVTTMKIKGAKVRMDLNAGQPQAMSIITDLNTGEVITLLHSQKLYLKTPGDPTIHTRTTGKASQAPVPRATGKTQKVGDYDTELYTWSNARGINGTAWVARHFPDYDRIQADLAVLDKSAGADNDTTPELSALSGMLVRSQVTGGGQTMTLALISAKETPLDAAQFGVPRDYKEVPKPKPLKPAGPQGPLLATPGNVTHSGNSQASGGSKISGNSKTTDNSKAPPGNFSTPKAPAW